MVEEKLAEKTGSVYQGRNGDREEKYGMCKGMDDDLAVPEKLTPKLWGKGTCWMFCTRDVSSPFPVCCEPIGQLVRVGPICGLSPTSSGPGVWRVRVVVQALRGG